MHHFILHLDFFYIIGITMQLRQMESIISDRKIPVYKLIPYKPQLLQLRSFSDPVERCNFTTYAGSYFGKGKIYVDDQGHGVDEYKSLLRGVEVLEVCYLKLTDYVILTEEQYKDYRVITGCD